MNILVIGATSGIGKSITGLLKNEGHQVIGCGRRINETKFEDGIHWMHMDVLSDSSVKTTIENAFNLLGKIDVLINSAGRGALGPIEAFSPEEIIDVFQLNFLGMHRVNRTILPIMRKQAFGKIIMISSLAAEAGLPYNGLYSSSKSALDILNESLRMEVKQFGIQTCVVQPGDFKTDVSANRKMPNMDKSSPYYDHFQTISKKSTDNVLNADDPDRVAQLVSKLVKKQNIKAKYRVGAPLELIMPKVKNILPQSWFEKLLLKYYGL